MNALDGVHYEEVVFDHVEALSRGSGGVGRPPDRRGTGSRVRGGELSTDGPVPPRRQLRR